MHATHLHVKKIVGTTRPSPTPPPPSCSAPHLLPFPLPTTSCDQKYEAQALNYIRLICNYLLLLETMYRTP